MSGESVGGLLAIARIASQNIFSGRRRSIKRANRVPKGFLFLSLSLCVLASKLLVSGRVESRASYPPCVFLYYYTSLPHSRVNFANILNDRLRDYRWVSWSSRPLLLEYFFFSCFLCKSTTIQRRYTQKQKQRWVTASRNELNSGYTVQIFMEQYTVQFYSNWVMWIVVIKIDVTYSDKMKTKSCTRISERSYERNLQKNNYN